MLIVIVLKIGGIMEKKRLMLIGILVVACTIMGYIDFVISPDYFVKAGAKLVLFFGLPLIYFTLSKNNDIKSLFRFDIRQVKFLALLGTAVFAIILGAYFLLGPYFDLTNITQSLENDIGVNKGNFIFVAMYIAIVNSFLEELFFRGFAFLELKKVTKGNTAMVLSSLFFALYHIAMIVNWFDIWLILLVTLALFVGGVIFNWLNQRYNNIYASWVVHMFANLAINIIGFILFGIIG